MAELVVIDANPERRLVAMVDTFRRHHVALVLAEMPCPESILSGPVAASGLALLIENRTGQIYRVRFEALDCGQLTAFELLREAPREAPEDPGSAASSSAMPFVPVRTTDTWESLAAERRADRAR